MSETLYQITDRYLNILELAEDPDIPQEAVDEALDAIDDDIENKVDGYGKIILELKGNIEKTKAEEKRLAKRRKTMENSVKRLKQNLQFNQEKIGKPKVTTGLFTSYIKRNAPSLRIDEEKADIPEEYLIPQPAKLDKRRLLKDMKETGMEVKGCQVVQTESLVIK